MTTERMIPGPNPIRCNRRPHRGVVALWTLLMIPVLLVMFAVVVEGVHLWLARVELENALEAAALAAVKEWAETGTGPSAGWTDGAREVGVQYAAANTINFTPVDIGKNIGGFDEASNPNENLSCEGNLVFGAIIEDDPAYVVATDQVPSCSVGAGRVLVDVTSQNLTEGDDSWGISFPTHPDEDFQDMLIKEIEIDIDPDETGRLRFDFSTSGKAPVLSSSSGPMVEGWAFYPGTENEQRVEQADNFGFYGWSAQTSPDYPLISNIPDPNDPEPFLEWPTTSYPQIRFHYVGDHPRFLNITFHAHKDEDGNIVYDSEGKKLNPGFGPGNRFRFGAGVVRVGGGGNFRTANGDHVGREGVRITVWFKDIDDPVSARFTDTGYSKNQCADQQDPGEWEEDDLGGWHVLVHPIRLLTPGVTPLIARDLPCPLTSAANNDQQSIVLMLGRGVGVGNHVVRAQATHPVPSLICSFLGIDFGGPFTVSACTTAMYDCELLRPRLIRVEPENFYCPTGP